MAMHIAKGSFWVMGGAVAISTTSHPAFGATSHLALLLLDSPRLFLAKPRRRNARHGAAAGAPPRSPGESSRAFLRRVCSLDRPSACRLVSRSCGKIREP
jgi:hypothetical protein